MHLRISHVNCCLSIVLECLYFHNSCIGHAPLSVIQPLPYFNIHWKQCHSVNPIGVLICKSPWSLCIANSYRWESYSVGKLFGHSVCIIVILAIQVTRGQSTTVAVFQDEHLCIHYNINFHWSVCVAYNQPFLLWNN